MKEPNQGQRWEAQMLNVTLTHNTFMVTYNLGSTETLTQKQFQNKIWKLTILMRQLCIVSLWKFET